jgi:hypothetical protein
MCSSRYVRSVCRPLATRLTPPQVEGQLFKLPRFLLEQSPVFRDMFSVPQGRECQEGRDLKNPIILHGYSAFDFTQLARVLIPR